jgi:hypothetical protein
MMKMNRMLLSAVLLSAALACRSGDEDGAAAARMDTTNADALDGMSSQAVEAKAEALTPEQAAARGIAVDSSIHVENLSSQDTTTPGASTPPAQPGSTGTVPATKGDTAPPSP